MNEDNPMRAGLRAEQLGDAARMERDRMAWEAYVAMLSNPDITKPQEVSAESLARLSYLVTDDWLAERDKQRGGK